VVITKNVETGKAQHCGMIGLTTLKAIKLKRNCKKPSRLGMPENRSPFDRPDVDVSEGNYIHAVKRMALPWIKNLTPPLKS